MLDDFGSPEALLADTHLTPQQLQLALAYRDEYPDEIAQAIDDNRRSPSELRSLYPFIQVHPS